MKRERASRGNRSLSASPRGVRAPEREVQCGWKLKPGIGGGGVLVRMMRAENRRSWDLVRSGFERGLVGDGGSRSFCFIDGSLSFARLNLFGYVVEVLFIVARLRVSWDE